MALPVPARVLVIRIERITSGTLALPVACRRCGQQEELRLVAVGPHLAAVCCDAWHVTVLPDLTPDEVALHVGPEVPRWYLTDGQVPDDLEAAHPGITGLLDRLGSALATPCRDPAQQYPTRLTAEEARRLDDLRVTTLNDRVRPRAAATPEQAHPDEVVLVPLTRRELELLHRLTSKPDDAVDYPGRIARALSQDLLRRAQELISVDAEHVRHVAAAHATALSAVRHLPFLRRTRPGPVRDEWDD